MNKGIELSLFPSILLFLSSVGRRNNGVSINRKKTRVQRGLLAFGAASLLRFIVQPRYGMTILWSAEADVSAEILDLDFDFLIVRVDNMSVIS